MISTYPNTPEFEGAVARQVLIANSFLDLSRVRVLGYAVPVPGITGAERAQKMYEAILKNAPYSIYAPITQFNLGLAFQRLKAIRQARDAYQKVLDKYPNSDVCDDALYQIAYIYMRLGLTSSSQDLSALVLSKETFEDFLLQYPKSEKAPQARDNLERNRARGSRQPHGDREILRLVQELQGGHHLLQRRRPQAAEIGRMRRQRRLASRSFAASSATTSFVSGRSVPNREKSWPFAAASRPKWKPQLLQTTAGLPSARLSRTNCPW